MRKKYIVLLTASYPEICTIGIAVPLDFSIILDHTKITDSDLSRNLLDNIHRMLFNSHLI